MLQALSIRQRTARTLVLVVAACSTAACGGSKDEGADTASKATSTLAPAVTRAEYIAEADKFCVEADKDAKATNEQVQAVLRQAASETEALAELTPLLEQGYEKKRASDVEFDKIEPPDEDRATVETLRAAAREDTALLGSIAEAARGGDVQRFTSLIEEQGRVRTRAEGLAQDYGFRACGSGAGKAG